MSESIVATVVSSPAPFFFHMYRSSQNFAASARAKRLRFKVVNHPNSSSISFNVMKDVRFWDEPSKLGKDEVIYQDVRSGSTMPINTGGALYIANPCYANGKNFTVEVYELYI